VRNTGSTGGGDMPECYELVLREAQSQNWTADSKKVLVVIGDAVPHDVSYPDNKLRLDWKQESVKLKDMGIQIYSVQALGRGYSDSFYATMAGITGGLHLKLAQFQEIVDLLIAIAYQQDSPEKLDAWEQRIADAKRMSRSLDNNFRILSGKAATAPGRYDSYTTGGLVPVNPGRFQILDVDHDVDIKGFVTANDLIFNLGRGFYQFTKTEEVQEKKEVVLRDKYTGDMFTGNEARNMIGVPYGTRDRLKPTALGKYDIFVQSTSVNRKLKSGTKFLYEVADDR
jgi:hypothetical protein